MLAGCSVGWPPIAPWLSGLCVCMCACVSVFDTCLVQGRVTGPEMGTCLDATVKLHIWPPCGETQAGGYSKAERKRKKQRIREKT